MFNRAREVVFCAVLCSVLIISGCGSGGSSSGSASKSSTSSDGSLTIEVFSGDSQFALVGAELGDPLTVLATNAGGKPVEGINVNFSISTGNALLSSPQTTTGPNGLASVKLTIGPSLGEISVRAESIGTGAITFNLTSRLPKLGELAGASGENGPISDMPAVSAELSDGTQVLALIFGGSNWLDLSGLPTAGELAGATLGGTDADTMPVVLLSATKLVNQRAAQPASAGNLLGTTLLGQNASDLPSLTGFSVNGGQVVLAINGDASGIAGAIPLADMVAANPTVEGGLPASELPVRIIDAADFPLAPDLENSIYISIFEKLVPVFSTSKSMSKASVTYALPSLEGSLALSDSELNVLTGAQVPAALVLNGITTQLETCLKKGSLEEIPAEYLPIVEIIQNELLSLGIEAYDAALIKIELYKQLLAVVKDNQVLLTDILESGETDDYLALMGLAGDLLPIIDDLLEMDLVQLDISERGIIVVRGQLLPAIGDLLPEDGIPFGGYSDGIASSVADNVLPLFHDQLGLALEAIPVLEILLGDITALIPDDGDVFELLENINNGAIDEILADLDALLPFTAEGLRIFADDGMPILYDLMEEVEYRIPPESLYIADLECYTMALDYLATVLPPEATLGDLPHYDKWGPALAPYLPLEWGEAAGVSVFDTVLPAIGAIDIGSDILPLIRQGLDSLDAALPSIIDNISNFSFFDIALPEITL